MLSAMESSVYGTQERGVKQEWGYTLREKFGYTPWDSVWDALTGENGERKAQTCAIAWFQQICEVNYFKDK